MFIKPETKELVNNTIGVLLIGLCTGGMLIALYAFLRAVFTTP